MGNRHAVGRTLALGTGLLFFGLFFFAPLGFFFSVSLLRSAAGEWAARVAELFAAPGTYRLVGFTIGQAACSAFISVVLALPGAYLISHFDFPLKRFFYSLSLIPFVLPSIIVIICMISFYGKRGLINRILGSEVNLIYNFIGILLAHVFYNFSLAIRIVGDGWQRIDRRYIEISQSFGERPLRRFRRIVLPLLMPSITTAFLLIFIYCFLSFGIILVFGGVRYSTLEVKIYMEIFAKLDFPAASLYAAVQLFFSVGFILLAGRTIQKFQVEKVKGHTPRLAPLRRLRPWKRTFVTLYLLLVGVFLFGPLLTMTVRSLRPGGSWSLTSYRALFDPALSSRNIEGIVRSTIPRVIGTSVVVAAASGSITFLLTLAISLSLKRRHNAWLEGMFQVPMGVSLVTLSLGLRMLYSGVLPPLLVVVTAQVFLAFPFVFRIVRTCVDELQQGYVEGAQSVGAGWLSVLLDVKLPILKQGLLNAYAYSLAIPFADLTAVLSIGRGEIATFPVAIYRLVGFRSFGMALALSVIYILVCSVLFAWIDITSLRKSKVRQLSGAAND